MRKDISCQVMKIFIESAYHIVSQMKAASKNRKKTNPERKILQRKKGTITGELQIGREIEKDR